MERVLWSRWRRRTPTPNPKSPPSASCSQAHHWIPRRSFRMGSRRWMKNHPTVSNKVNYQNFKIKLIRRKIMLRSTKKLHASANVQDFPFPHKKSLFWARRVLWNILMRRMGRMIYKKIQKVSRTLQGMEILRRMGRRRGPRTQTTKNNLNTIHISLDKLISKMKSKST